MLDRIALFVLLLAGLNLGLVGLFQFDFVAWAFGGVGSALSRVIYVLFAAAAVWSVSLFFKRNEIVDEDRHHAHSHDKY